MNYALIRDVVTLCEEFQSSNQERGEYSDNISGFKSWVADNRQQDYSAKEPDWQGKEIGRSPESVISTLLVHMNRYAKAYSRSAIHNSNFSTQEDFIYLINLKAFGAMTKMDLVKKNVQEKPAGMQVINRLIEQGWIEQQNSETDKRSKVIRITEAGLQALEGQMDKIRIATRIVTADLTHKEKMELIRLLNKLDHFHKPIFLKNIDSAELLDRVTSQYSTGKS